MKKEKLVLIPGLLCDERLWSHQKQYLAELVEIVIGDTFQDHTVEMMAKRILAQVDGSFSLAGLSMGGYVAQEIMRQAPQRVKRLALLDTSARKDDESQARRRRGLINLAKMGKFKGVTPRLLPMLVHPDRLDDEKLTNAVMEMAAHVGQSRFVDQQNAILHRPDGIEDLSRFAVDTMVVCGRQDEITPLELSEEIAAHVPKARLVIIEDCGHLSSMERPQAVTALMRDWLLRKP
ncbi:alpha/beta fold hydrolase [Aestuariispira insulae]|uniref:Pimeloyl-ACP methyl ester carboxylesterase n=1 Tax=Aestuariispira insulae TaxID=1461337 RepID=A0A3D9HN59_9PROT|nr:alpha/beta hydrolase [Aestuariispira insulae]RED50933.1 pimeloyl-ACP methyl ester carboxylesterase [Aestuariispira insulae]